MGTRRGDVDIRQIQRAKSAYLRLYVLQRRHELTGLRPIKQAEDVGQALDDFGKAPERQE
jgi:hypothetical protein